MQPSCKDDVLRNRDSKTFGSVSKQSVAELTGMSGLCVARSFRETIQISTLICSTKLTQKSEPLSHILISTLHLSPIVH